MPCTGMFELEAGIAAGNALAGITNSTAARQSPVIASRIRASEGRDGESVGPTPTFVGYSNSILEEWKASGITKVWRMGSHCDFLQRLPGCERP